MKHFRATQSAAPLMLWIQPHRSHQEEPWQPVSAPTPQLHSAMVGPLPMEASKRLDMWTLLNKRLCFSMPSTILADVSGNRHLQWCTSTGSKRHVHELWLVHFNRFCLFLFFRVNWLPSYDWWQWKMQLLLVRFSELQSYSKCYCKAYCKLCEYTRITARLCMGTFLTKSKSQRLPL